MKILLTCVIGFLQYLQTTVNAVNWQQGLCLGQHIQAQSSYTPDECLFDCKNTLNCNYATFDTKNKVCHLNSGCSKVVKFADAKYEFAKKDSDFKGQRYLMVASGNTDATVEVIDLLGNPSTTFCRNLPEFPQPNVTDGLAAIFNASPLICGGATDNEDEFSSKCYHLIDDAWVLGPTMTTSRSQASILTIGDEGSEMLLVTGGSGKSGEGSLKSSEKLNVTSVQWESSFQLPIPSYGHCAVEINSTTILIIGGGIQQFGSKSTKIMHLNGGGKTQNGPKLRQKRREHSCGILHQNNTKYVIVSGGISQTMLKSTETLELTENIDQQWMPGPDLPTALTKSQMLSDEDTESVYLIGGKSDTKAMSTIWRLFDVDNNWIESKHRLSIPRAGHVALFLPQKLTQCYSQQKRID